MITIIGGGFTRSWLSLPLSHGTKVKGGKNPMLGVWFIPPIPVAVGPAQLPAAFPTVHRCLSIQGWHRPLFLPYRMGKSSCGPGIPFFLSLPCVPTLLWLNPTGLRWSGHGLKFNPAFWVAWLENYGCLLHLLLLILAVSLLLLFPFPIL